MREPSVLSCRWEPEAAPWTTIRSLVEAAPGIAMRAIAARAMMSNL